MVEITYTTKRRIHSFDGNLRIQRIAACRVAGHEYQLVIQRADDGTGAQIVRLQDMSVNRGHVLFVGVAPTKAVAMAACADKARDSVLHYIRDCDGAECYISLALIVRLLFAEAMSAE